MNKKHMLFVVNINKDDVFFGIISEKFKVPSEDI